MNIRREYEKPCLRAFVPVREEFFTTDHKDTSIDLRFDQDRSRVK